MKDFVRLAQSLYDEGRAVDAVEELEQGVSEMPPDWSPVSESAELMQVAFWDSEEFLSYTNHVRTHGPHKKVIWVSPSYSKAYYLLAYICYEQDNFDDALELIDEGLALEPDHPLMLCERALTLNRLGRHEEALGWYLKAERARAWTPTSVKAKALRGQGVVLIDLGRLDEAESALKRSQLLEPDNEGARNELEYIVRLRREQTLKSQPPGSPKWADALVENLYDRLEANRAEHPGLPPNPLGDAESREGAKSNVAKFFRAYSEGGKEALERSMHDTFGDEPGEANKSGRNPDEDILDGLDELYGNRNR